MIELGTLLNLLPQNLETRKDNLFFIDAYSRIYNFTIYFIHFPLVTNYQVGFIDFKLNGANHKTFETA